MNKYIMTILLSILQFGIVAAMQDVVQETLGGQMDACSRSHRQAQHRNEVGADRVTLPRIQ